MRKTKKLAFQKNKVGKSSNLVPESEAINRTDLDPKDMRRMCILRGVYPREMPKDKSSPWSYFHKEDLTMINNDSMAWYIREHASWLKHHNKRFYRQEQDGTAEPIAPYDQLIRSRYPRFTDALRDLDDALTTVALFAQMSGSKIIASDRVLNCRHLIAEFHYYVSHKHLLTKGFISKRGFHFEANIEGVPIVWLLPHQFTLQEDPSVDYTVLLNFLELYENLLGFVNLRLFKKIGLKYKPEYDQKKWDAGYYIDAIIDSTPTKPVEGVAEAPAPEITEESKEKVLDAFSKAAQNQEATEETEVVETGVFGKLVFTIGREVSARDSMALIIRSLGGTIIWDENSLDKSITHTICDRKQIKDRVLTRKYVQPQWVVDCLNKHAVLEEGPYAPGEVLPPHLSPWDVTVQEEEGEEDADKEAVVNDDSDAEIDEHIKQVAMAAEHEEGIAQELGLETKGTDLEALRASEKAKKEQEKEAREKLIASTLPARKAKIYHELKEKEEKKLKKKKGADPEAAETVHVDEDAMENNQ